MPTAEKKEVIDGLNQVFATAKSAVIADYQRINADELAALRSHMKERSVEFRVIKNTLAQKAAKDTPFEVIEDRFKGPTSLLVSYDDLVAPARALKEYEKSGAEKTLKVICGIVEGKAIDPQGIKALADLPPKEVLLSQMLSAFQGPTTQFVGVFNSVLRGFVGTLGAIKDKKAKEG